LENFVAIFCGLSHRLDGEGYLRRGQRQEEPGPTLRCLTPVYYSSDSTGSVGSGSGSGVGVGAAGIPYLTGLALPPKV